MAIVAVIVVVMLAVVGIMCIKAVSMGKQPIRPTDNNGQAQATNVRSSAQTYKTLGDTKDFIPITNIDDYSFCIGDFNYRAIVECSAVNFGLMNEMEQDRVEASYSQFLNSISFPIEIYVQTREFDKDTMIDNIHNNTNRAIKKYPMVADYGNTYVEQISYLMGDFIPNTKIKKNFVIVSYSINDMTDVSALSASEVKEFALQELSTRAMIVKNGLEGVGIHCDILDKKGIIECLYAYYHRDYYKIARDFASGLYNSIMVNRSNVNNYFDKESLDRILAETQNRIKNLASPDSSKEEIAFFEHIYQTLDSLKAIPSNEYEYYLSMNEPDLLKTMETDMQIVQPYTENQTVQQPVVQDVAASQQYTAEPGQVQQQAYYDPSMYAAYYQNYEQNVANQSERGNVNG